MCIVVEFPHSLKSFETKVKSRLSSAYATSTKNAQQVAVSSLAAFCIFYNLQFPAVTVLTLLSFVEFLNDNNLAPATIKNYLSSCKAKFKQAGLPVVNFNSNLVKLALKALYKAKNSNFKPKHIITNVQFEQLVVVMQHHPLYLFYKLALLLGFLGMLRISNVANISFRQFNLNKHLSRGDITINSNGLQILLKWTKTLQNYTQGATISLPAIPNSNLCPLQTFQLLQQRYPVKNTQPLLSYNVGHNVRLITRSTIQNMLKEAIVRCNIQQNITFHCLRRSAASLAFASGVPIEQIKAHGTWASEAVWTYIHSSVRSAVLPKFFKAIFSPTSTAPLGSG
jgi:integrase